MEIEMVNIFHFWYGQVPVFIHNKTKGIKTALIGSLDVFLPQIMAGQIPVNDHDKGRTGKNIVISWNPIKD